MKQINIINRDIISLLGEAGDGYSVINSSSSIQGSNISNISNVSKCIGNGGGSIMSGCLPLKDDITGGIDISPGVCVTESGKVIIFDGVHIDNPTPDSITYVTSTYNNVGEIGRITAYSESTRHEYVELGYDVSSTPSEDSVAILKIDSNGGIEGMSRGVVSSSGDSFTVSEIDALTVESKKVTADNLTIDELDIQKVIVDNNADSQEDGSIAFVSGLEASSLVGDKAIISGSVVATSVSGGVIEVSSVLTECTSVSSLYTEVVNYELTNNSNVEDSTSIDQDIGGVVKCDKVMLDTIYTKDLEFINLAKAGTAAVKSGTGSFSIDYNGLVKADKYNNVPNANLPTGSLVMMHHGFKERFIVVNGSITAVRCDGEDRDSIEYYLTHGDYAVSSEIAEEMLNTLFSSIGNTWGGDTELNFRIPQFFTPDNTNICHLVGAKSGYPIGSIRTNDKVILGENLPDHTHTTDDVSDLGSANDEGSAVGNSGYGVPEILRSGTNVLYDDTPRDDHATFSTNYYIRF